MAGTAPPVWPLDLDQAELTGDSGELLNPILIDDALDILKAIVRGNGLDPKAVTFAGASGETLHLTLPIVFRASPEFSKKIMAGKQRGMLIGSVTAAQNRVAGAIAAGVRGDVWPRYVVNMLEKRQDAGVGIDGLTLAAPAKPQNFVTQEKCPTCQGHAATTCAACHGKGSSYCRTCHGSGQMTCPACRGRMFLDQERRRPCMRCNVRGKVDCTACQASGQRPCRACKATGRAGCRACNGTGWRSILLTGEIKLRGRFVYDPAVIPADLLQVMKDLKGALVTLRHAEAKLEWNSAAPGSPAENTAAAPVRQNDEIAIPCRLRLPFARLAVDLGTTRVEGEMFGFHPSLLRFPSFLETLAAAGFRDLAAAAAGGPGPVGGNLRKAARYRVIADALRAAMRFPQARAVKALDRRYPAGLSAEGARRVITQARAALRRLARIGRWSGLAAGGAVMMAMDAALLAWPRGAGILMTPPLGPLFDALLVAGGSGMIVVLAQEGGGLAMRRALPFLKGGAARPHVADIAAAFLASALIFIGAAGALHRLPQIHWPQASVLRGVSNR